MSGNFRPTGAAGHASIGGWDGRHPLQQVNEVLVYQDPLTASTYDPDGLQSLLSKDEIDWDDESIWETFPWVTYGEVDSSVAGPTWEDMEHDAQMQWYQDNKDLVESHVGELHIGSGSAMSQLLFGAEHSELGNLYDDLRQQGAMGGTEIDYSYYQKDPYFSVIFGNINWEREELEAPDWSTPGEGVTEDHLRVAMKYAVETARMIRDDRYRDPWDAELPGAWEPVELETDYEGYLKDNNLKPIDIKTPIQKLPSPTMSNSLQSLKHRSGSDMEGQWNTNWAQANPVN